MPKSFKESFPPADILLQLPREELALHVLAYLRDAYQSSRRNPNRYNFTLPSNQELIEYAGPRVLESARALTEAWMWLEREGMLAPEPGRMGDGRDWVYITKQGETYRTAADVEDYRHAQMLRSQALDAELAEKVLPLFRPDDYDTPVFKAFLIVEIRVRQWAGLPETITGVDLMRAAFDAERGPLRDTRLPLPERQAMAHFFAGAFGLFRNPSGHREHVKTAGEAAGRVICANELLRILGSLPRAQSGAMAQPGSNKA